MTYLQLVNKILRRLREQTVASVDESEYSLLVGEFVNDAKKVVEDAWPWRSLIDTVTIPLVAGTATYDIEDVNCANSGAPPRANARLYKDPQSSQALSKIITDNEESFVSLVSPSWSFVESTQAENDSVRAKPTVFWLTTNPTAVAGQSNMRVRPYPTPDASYNLQMYLVNPQNDLENSTDVLLVPYQPVLMMAYLYCLYERGEEVGEMLTLTTQKTEMAMADAIMHDSGNTSEVIFEV